jgi:hypothetical protein
MASAQVQWLKQYTANSAEDRAQYAEFARQDDLWVHETPEAAWAAIEQRMAMDMELDGTTRGWDPGVFRVEISIEPVTRD